MKAAASTPRGFIPEARGTNPVRCKTHGYHDKAKARTTNVANGCFFTVFSRDAAYTNLRFTTLQRLIQQSAMKCAAIIPFCSGSTPELRAMPRVRKSHSLRTFKPDRPALDRAFTPLASVRAMVLSMRSSRKIWILRSHLTDQ